ncbi:hypothetical protein A2W39_03030 [Candidatus Azambacteria bacterium RIFCSPHIGHO2_01_46_10]|uniref:Pup--protein ligase n=1 Tax=Candidatus Azambacteria bacterium RIFCSPHIGHO2_01_46_10 TaxID=1797293 RepID=A0A1F5BZI6_9BACT|nr:MAG: hypothetical protein A2W39_03030 [Candidatus Azambacteria bacterium RIFCSPHIGHO2_01_46_10]
MKKPRIIGQEVEYALATIPYALPDTLFRSDAAKCFFDTIRERVFENSDRLLSQFLPNGARLYCDTGGHPEYATPECLGPKQLVCAEQAGDRFLEQIQSQANRILKERKPAYQTYQIRLYKNNTDNRGETWGCHENYLIKPRLFSELTSPLDKNELRNIFISYLISSIIYTGSGDVVKLSNNSLAFHVSQRAKSITRIFSNSTTSNRPLINSRDEAHAKTEEWRRLHLIARDSNMSPLAVYLKFGTASIILEMLETNPRLFGRNMVLRDPIESLRYISGDSKLKAVSVCSDYLEYTALEIQKMFCETAARYVEQNGSKEDKEVVSRWQEVLDALSRYATEPELLVGKIDWITKKYLISEKIRKICKYSEGDVFSDSFFDDYWKRVEIKPNQFVSPADLAMAMHYQYHDIRQDKGLFYLVSKNDETLVSKEDVDSMIDDAPKGARAELRGFLVKEFKQYGEIYDMTFNWNYCCLQDNLMKIEQLSDVEKYANRFLNLTFEFPNPYERRLPPGYDEVLKFHKIIDEIPEQFRPAAK